MTQDYALYMTYRRDGYSARTAWWAVANDRDRRSLIAYG